VDCGPSWRTPRYRYQCGAGPAVGNLIEALHRPGRRAERSAFLGCQQVRDVVERRAVHAKRAIAPPGFAADTGYLRASTALRSSSLFILERPSMFIRFASL